MRIPTRKATFIGITFPPLQRHGQLNPNRESGTIKEGSPRLLKRRGGSEAANKGGSRQGEAEEKAIEGTGLSGTGAEPDQSTSILGENPPDAGKREDEPKQGQGLDRMGCTDRP